MTEQTMTRKAAAAVLRMSSNTLKVRAWRLRQRGIEVGTYDGNAWRYTAADLLILAKDYRRGE